MRNNQCKDSPSSFTPEQHVSGKSYALDQCVQIDGKYYQSLIADNTDTPSAISTTWAGPFSFCEFLSYKIDTPDPDPINTPPVITVLGDNPVDLTVQSGGPTGYMIGDYGSLDPTAINQPLIARLDIHAGFVFTTQADLVSNILDDPDRLVTEGWLVFFDQSSLDAPYVNNSKYVNWFYDDDGVIRNLDPIEFLYISPDVTPYTDPGATALDAEDGDLTTAIITGGVNTVDVTTAGQYVVTYDVTDSGGLTDHKERIINVS